MGDLDFDIDNNEPVSMDFEPLPPGKYQAKVTLAEVVDNSKGDGQILKLTFDIIDLDFKGRKVFENLNISNPSEKAQQIARGQLSSLCRAIGRMGIMSNSFELLDKPVMLKLKIEPPQNGYAAKNKIIAYESCNGGKSEREKPVKELTNVPKEISLAEDDLPF